MLLTELGEPLQALSGSDLCLGGALVGQLPSDVPGELVDQEHNGHLADQQARAQDQHAERIAINEINKNHAKLKTMLL